MKKIIKVLALILCLALAFSVSACKSDTGNTDVTTTTKAVATTTAGTTAGQTTTTGDEIDPAIAKYLPVEGKVYKINLLSMQSVPVENDAKMVQYWNKYFNIELNIANIPDIEALNIKIASGDIPDTLFANSYVQYVKLAKDGILAELPTGVMEVVAPDMYFGYEKEYPGFWEDLMIDGKIYSVQHVNHWGNYRIPIIWRGDWLKNVGITKTPSNIDEVVDALYKFAQNDPDGNDQNDTYGLSKSGMWLIYSAFGYYPINDWYQERDGKLVPGIIQPEMKDALKILSKMYQDGVLDPEFVTGENQGGYWPLTQPFINGRIGLSMRGYFYHWIPRTEEGGYAGAIWDALNQVNPEAAKSMIIADPIENIYGERNMITAGSSDLTKGSGRTLYPGYYNSISKKVADEEPDKLGKLLQIFNEIGSKDVEMLATAVYGIKGEDWDYDDKGVPARKPGIEVAEETAKGGNTLMFFGVLPSIYRQAYPLHFENGDKYGFNSYTVLSNAVTKPLPSGEKYSEELSKIANEAYIDIITGAKPVDYFDTFVEKWLAAGGSILVEEAQAYKK